MMQNNIKETIENSQMILVGLGEELDETLEIKKSDDYRQIEAKTENSWILPFVMRKMLKDRTEKKQEFYTSLFQLLKDKNYFVVSVCMDGYLNEFAPEKERVVSPCGQFEKLQCSGACSETLYDISEETEQQIERFIQGELKESDIAEPVCPCCGKSLVFNNIQAEAYLESGYLEQWGKYTKWLQGTLNRNLCLIELGVGMKYPTVIRWPFEKTAFFNQKAKMYRVHSRLYQVTEELKEKAAGICENPENFVKELSKES